MKNFLKNTATLILIAIVLTATIGVPYTEHICLMSGEKEYSILEDNGCVTDCDEATQTDDCCASVFKYAKVDTKTILSNISAKTISFFSYVEVFKTPIPSLVLIGNPTKLFSDSSPPTSKDIVLLSQSFRL
ncbi:MAG: hypothetical protein NTX03_07120 [Bacteroidetes bacterium]|nr:hypothetical protein [Bacteroidota bacterium]